MTHDPTSGLHVTRAIPLWGLLCALGIFCGQFVMIWAGQREHGLLLAQQSVQLLALAEQQRLLGIEVGTKSLKDVEHDIRISDFERRIADMERRKHP